MMVQMACEALVCSVHFNLAEFWTYFERAIDREMPIDSISQSFLNEAVSNSIFSTRQSPCSNYGCIYSESTKDIWFSYNGGGKKFNLENVPMTCWLKSLLRYDFEKNVDTHSALKENIKYNRNTSDLSFSNTVSSLQDENVNAVISEDEISMMKHNVSCILLNGSSLQSAKRENEQNNVIQEEESNINDKSIATSIGCDICGDQFKNIKHLRTHHFICIKDKPYQYTECEQPFLNSKVFKMHLCKHLCLNWNSTQIDSNQFSKTVVQPNDKSEYLESEKNLEVVKTLECSDSVLNDNTLLLKYKENDGLVLKNEENSSFVTGDQTMHLNNKKDYSSDSGDNSLLSKNEKIEISNENRIIDCDVESKIAKDFSSNVEVRNLHCSNSEKTTCEKPTVSESIDDNLKQNITRQSNLNSKQDSDVNNELYSCAECGIQISSFDNLKNHLGIPCKEQSLQNFSNAASDNDSIENQIHTMALLTKPDVIYHCCEICNKTFATRKDLFVHIWVHMSVEPNKCIECDDGFVCYDALKNHLKSHSSRAYSRALKKKLFKCKICPSSFERRNKLIEHLQIHTNARGFKCELCGKGFNQKATLRSHMWTHSREEVHESSLNKHLLRNAELKVTRQSNLNSQDVTDANKKKHSCAECNMKFSSIENLKTHLGIPWEKHSIQNTSCCDHLVGQIYTESLVSKSDVEHHYCDVCDKNFATREDLLVHLWFHLNIEPHKCIECEKQFVCYDALRNHLKSHSSSSSSLALRKKLYKCKICPSSFEQRNKLNDHLQIHTNVRGFKCELCGKGFNQKATLRSHMETHSDGKVHECSICNKKFVFKKSLNRHLQSHAKPNITSRSNLNSQDANDANKKKYSCAECDMKFSSIENLKRHLGLPWKKQSIQDTSCNNHLISQLYTEAGIPESNAEHHRCDICEKNLKPSEDLLVHLWFHLNIEPHKCTECDKQFVCYDALQKHLKSHSNKESSQAIKKKLYKCKICPSRFSTRWKLNEHVRIHTNAREFKCEFCNKGFNQKFTLKTHMLSHSDEKAQECSICHMKFKFKNSLSKHLQKHAKRNVTSQSNLNSQDVNDANKKEYSCAECSMTFSSIENLKIHLGIPWKKNSKQDTSCCDHLVSQIYTEALVSESDVEHHYCDVCDKSFETREDLLVHLWFHLNIEPHKCTECEKQFVCYDALQKHLNSHSSHLNSQSLKKKLFKCKICPSSFQWRTRLNKHLQIHTNAREFKCKVCGKGFNQKSALRGHMSSHSDVKAYECPICNIKLGKKSSLVRHLQNHAGIKPYECDVCPFKFDTPGKLKQHYRRHTGEKPYVCHICDKKFKRRIGFKAHLAKHTGNLQYECDVCHKKFYLNSTLTAHKQIHSKEKLFACDICGKSYLRKVALKQHYRLHTNEKPYVCSVCNKAFVYQSIYERHVLIHTGVKPYECKICKMSFNQKTSLDRHQVVHTKEKPYSCDICNMSFTQKAYLSFHKRKHL